MSEATGSEETLRFSLVAGGPFHSILGRFGLLGHDGLPTWAAALLLAAAAWVAPAIAAVIQSLLHPDYPGWRYFSDGTVYTRYVIAIFAMVATERFADGRISMLVNQFLQARLLAPDARNKFREHAISADRIVSWPPVEGILLVLALGWSWLSFYFVTRLSAGGWEEWDSGGDSIMSWAGVTAELLSNPVFLFLVLRWFWRFLVWTWLLCRTARLPLQLLPIHPDRAGGLNFLSLFPGIFGGFIFALSCVVSSSLLKTMALAPPSQWFIWLVIGGWVLLMLLIFLGPLLLFSPPLFRAREQALLEYGRLAQIHHQAFHQAWLQSGTPPEKMLGSPDPSSVSDLNAAAQTALGMKIVPLDLAAVLQTVVPAAAPFLVVVASQVPLSELLKWLLASIF